MTLPNFNSQGRKGLSKRAEFQLPAKGMKKAQEATAGQFQLQCTVYVLAFLSTVDRGSPSLQRAEAAFA